MHIRRNILFSRGHQKCIDNIAKGKLLQKNKLKSTLMLFSIKSHAADPRNLRGIDLLACLLAQEKKTKELESLALSATSVTDSAPQPWIAVGYYCQLEKRTPKAIYFAHKVRLE